MCHKFGHLVVDSYSTQVHLIASPIPWLYFSTDRRMFSTEGEHFQLKVECFQKGFIHDPREWGLAKNRPGCRRIYHRNSCQFLTTILQVEYCFLSTSNHQSKYNTVTVYSKEQREG
jgi:hypothetical protein